MILDFVTIEITENDFTQWSLLLILKAKMYLLCFLSTAKFYLPPEMLIKKYSFII